MATHYDPKLNYQGLEPIKTKAEVTNVQFGRQPTALVVDPNPEEVPKPRDMTRQIPRRNETGVQGLGKPFSVASIKHNTQHVPLRAPKVVHGVNSLANAQAGVITGDAEFFGKQQSVPGLKDTLNEDPLDYIKRDMTRVDKANAEDKVEFKSGLHNTAVRRTRTRKPTKMAYL